MPHDSNTQRVAVMVVAFLAWMFAGYQIALFVLIHRAAMIDLLSRDGASPSEQNIKEWFAWFQAAFLLGAAAGGWIFGVLGDRFGRAKALGWSVLCYSLLTGACYVARDPYQLLTLRFLASLGIGGAWPNTVALVAEAWPDASRPLLAGILGAAANVGQVLMGFVGVALAIHSESWRWTLLLGSAPAFVGVWCWTGLPESVRWLESRAAAAKTPSRPLRDLFQPDLRGRLVLGILLGAIPVIGTAANAQWIVPWADQVQAARREKVAPPKADAGSSSTQAKPNERAKAWTTISRSTGATFGSLVGGVLAGLLGRRASYFAMSLATLFASTAIFGYFTPAHPWWQVAAFVFGFVGVIYFGWLPLYLPELFPTRVRASGTGISFNTGRVVAAVVVLATGLLLKQFGGDYARIGLWTGLIYACGMVAILFAPKTDSQSLKE